MSAFEEECPVCEQVIGGSTERGAAANLARHIESKHPDENSAGEEYSVDEPPAPRKARAKKARAPKMAAPLKGGSVPLQIQLQLPYNLLADVTANRLPYTSAALRANAPAAAAAWDRFIMRYPALREKIEQGMVGADVIALVVVHLEILRVAREEIAAQNANLQHYEGGIGADQAA